MRQGIDGGNYYTKSSTGFKYMSGLCADSTAMGASNRIIYNGQSFTVGERRDAIENDKTSSENMLIMSLPAIGEAIKRNMLSNQKQLPTGQKVELELGVGTPLKKYGKDAENYKEYFLDRDIEFWWNGEPFHVDIKRVEVYPQGYAAYLANYEKYAELKELNVVDIGGGTIDAFMILDGMPVTDTFKTLNNGVITLVNQCKDDLDMYGIRISEAQICNSIMGEPVSHLKKDLINTICEGKRNRYIAADVITQLKERKYDFSVPTLFIGGGAMLLEKYWS